MFIIRKKKSDAWLLIWLPFYFLLFLSQIWNLLWNFHVQHLSSQWCEIILHLPFPLEEIIDGGLGTNELDPKRPAVFIWAVWKPAWGNKFSRMRFYIKIGRMLGWSRGPNLYEAFFDPQVENHLAKLSD